jgi:uncharacterized membrane protein
LGWQRARFSSNVRRASIFLGIGTTISFGKQRKGILLEGFGLLLRR